MRTLQKDFLSSGHLKFLKSEPHSQTHQPHLENVKLSIKLFLEFFNDVHHCLIIKMAVGWAWLAVHPMAIIEHVNSASHNI